MLKTMSVKIGDKVKVNIKNKDQYTSDLYKSIQGEVGIITQKQSELSSYDNAWLVKFSDKAKKKYAKTHSGKWAGGAELRMEWWTEERDFEVVS